MTHSTGEATSKPHNSVVFRDMFACKCMRMRAYACTQAGPSLFVFKYPFPRKNTATLTMRIICFLAVAVPCAESMIHCAGTRLCASRSIVPNIACICFFPGFSEFSGNLTSANDFPKQKSKNIRGVQS